MPIRNPRWLLPQVIVLTQDHMGKYRNIFFSEAIALIEHKLCINHWKVLCKLRVFYVDRNSKMTTTARHSFYIGPIGSFYKQVNYTGSWERLVFSCNLWSCCSMHNSVHKTKNRPLDLFYTDCINPNSLTIRPSLYMYQHETQCFQ
jgi:hypothetical protein